MADASIGYGIGSLGQGFLAGRQARIQQQQADTQSAQEQINQQAHDLENQKYQLYKGQQAVGNAQEAYKAMTARILAARGAGSTPYQYVGQENANDPNWAIMSQALGGRSNSPQSQTQPAPTDDSSQPAEDGSSGPSPQPSPSGQPQSSNSSGSPFSLGVNTDLSNSQGQGLMARPPGSGFVAPQPQLQQQYPNSTVPSTTAEMNPGAAQTQPQITSFPGEQEQMALFSAKIAAQKEAQSKVNDALAAGGEGYVGKDQNGNPIPVITDQGPMKNTELTNAQFNNRSAFGAVSGQFKEDPSVVAAFSAQKDLPGAMNAYKAASAGNAAAAYTLFGLAAKANGLAETDPAKIIAMGSGSDRLRDAASHLIGKSVSQKTLDNLISDVGENFSSKVDDVNTVKPLYAKKALKAGADPNLVTSTPVLDKTNQQVKQVLAGIPGRSLPSQQYGPRGVLGVVGGPSASQAAPLNPVQQAQQELARRKAQNGGQ